MWDDSLGPGLQIALFDAVARTFDVPVHALLGTRLVERTPLSWWNIDTSPEDMAAECQEALRQGYRPTRPRGGRGLTCGSRWKLVAKVVPENFKIDMDFNDTLLDAERAIPILLELEKSPQVESGRGRFRSRISTATARSCAAVRGRSGPALRHPGSVPGPAQG